jgi:hypothetical protein
MEWTTTANVPVQYVTAWQEDGWVIVNECDYLNALDRFSKSVDSPRFPTPPFARVDLEEAMKNQMVKNFLEGTK